MALALRLVFYVGPLRYDAFIYDRASFEIATGSFEFNHVNHGRHRFSHLLPAVLGHRVAGFREATCMLPTLAASMGLVVMAYLLGVRFGGVPVGLLSAGLMAFHPLDLHMATLFYPDTTQAFWLSIALWCFLRSEEPDAAHPGAWLAACGLAAFAAYSAKETTIFAFAVVIAWAAIERRIRVRWLWVGCVFMLCGAAEMAVFARFTGDPFFRFRGLGINLTAWFKYFNYVPGAFHYVYGYPSFLLWPLERGFSLMGLHGYLLLGVLLTRGLECPVRRLWVWIGVWMVLSIFWPMRLWPYHPALTVEPRHLYPVILPMSIITGRWLMDLLEKRRFLALGAMGITAAIAVAFTALTWTYTTSWSRGSREAFAPAMEPRLDPVLCDPFTLALFEVWSSYEPRLRNHPLHQDDPTVPAGSRVVVNEQYIEFLAAQAGRARPAWLDSPPSTWSLAWEGRFARRRQPTLKKGSGPGEYRIRIYDVR